MKTSVLLILTGLFFAAAGCASNKKEQTRIYRGSTKAMYEYNALDYMTGEFTHETWDTTFADELRVVTDPARGEVRFFLTEYQGRARPAQWAYVFPLDKAASSYSWTDGVSGHGHRFYFTAGDSLYGDYRFFSGYGPNNTKVSVTFSGRQ